MYGCLYVTRFGVCVFHLLYSQKRKGKEAIPVPPRNFESVETVLCSLSFLEGFRTNLSYDRHTQNFPLINLYCSCNGLPQLGYREILLGVCYKMDMLLWHLIMNHILWSIWKSRCSNVFSNKPKDFRLSCTTGIQKNFVFL
ncbi:hypothetical protein KP509_34G024400 [Ceratopteris richardii]|uniref:Uncharacterized protein n=1 Tax=Ceratopteris richardii TaxID=49495 RepID=A0A8T2QIR3_CERRI|nr:hypothetical protein KP509_34G024400 [Ceratopteris richardii]